MVLGGAALAALLMSQCGYPHFEFPGDTSSSGTGGGATTSTTSSSSSSSSGTGGGAPASCTLRKDAQDCGAGMRCTILDQDKGTTHCVAIAASPEMPYEACDDDSRCPAATWCDLRTHVCKPFCDTAADCNGNAGNCVAAQNSSGKTVPGAFVCTAHCDPITAIECSGASTCTYDSKLGDFDCFRSKGYMSGNACTYLSDCGVGLVCASSACVYWCHPAPSASSPDCLGGPCSNFSNLMPSYNGSVYGYCN
jgi:hypothetical protein